MTIITTEAPPETTAMLFTPPATRLLDRPLRVGVLGCGSIGQRHIRNLLTFGVDVLAYDPDPERRAIATTLGARAVPDDDQLLGADAMVDARPASARSGSWWTVPALYEKPLALTAADAKRIAGEGRGMVGFNFRFNRSLLQFREVIRSGELGGLLCVRIEFGYELARWRPGRDWRETPSAQKRLGGGIIHEAAHELDLLRWLFGEWTTCTAVVRTDAHPIDVEDTAAALIETIDGVLIELHLDMTRPSYRRRIEVIGRTDTALWEFNPADELNAMYFQEIRAFCRWVKGTEPLPPHAATLEDGIAALELGEAIRTSAERRATVFRFEGEYDPERFMGRRVG